MAVNCQTSGLGKFCIGCNSLSGPVFKHLQVSAFKAASCWFNYVSSQRHSRHCENTKRPLTALVACQPTSVVHFQSFKVGPEPVHQGVRLLQPRHLLTPVNTPNGAIAAPNTAFVQELVRCPDLASVSRGWGDYKCLICLSCVEHRLLWDRLPALGLRHAGTQKMVSLRFKGWC